MNDVEVEGAKKIGGIWFPDTDQHFVEMMGPDAIRHRVLDGKWTYQIHKLEGALAYQINRRRCIDIGAHVGLWSMWLVRHFNRIESFEPVPDHARLFELNVDMATVTLHREALGAKAGTVSIETAADATGSAHVVQGGGGDMRNGHGSMMSYHNIEMRTLDSYEFENVDFIKIDVEGYEREVVRGALDTLKRCRPNIIIEQKGQDQIYGHRRNSAMRLLRRIGYHWVKEFAGDHILIWD